MQHNSTQRKANMKSYDDEKLQKSGHSHKSSGAAEKSDLLKGKIAELIATKEELKRAKDTATQSWLDSRPLLDELEKLQAAVGGAQDRSSMSNIVVSDLESQLQSIVTSIQTKKSQELESTKTIEKLTREIDRARLDVDEFKLEIDDQRRARQKIKQVLRTKRQRLRTIQLELRAVRMESEAAKESQAEAGRYLNCARKEVEDVVQLSGEEYRALIRRAREEESLAEWRVAAAMEQKASGEASRDLALARLKRASQGNYRPRRRADEDDQKYEEDGEGEGEGGGGGGMSNEVDTWDSVSPRARTKATAEDSDFGPEAERTRIGGRKMLTERTKKNKKKKKKKKTNEKERASFFGQIRRFLRSILKIFG